MKTRNQKSQRKNRLQVKQKTKTPADASFAVRYATSYLNALIIDASRILIGHYSIADATRDCETVEKRFASEGLGFATKTLPVLVEGLLNLYEGHAASFPQFRKKRGTEHPVFLHRLFHLALTSTDDGIKGRAFDIIYSISVAFKKYKGDYPKDVLLKQFSDFVKTDIELESLDLFEETTFSILEGARKFIANIMKDVSLDMVKKFLPRPGPGATNTPTEKTERFRPRVLYKQINDVLDYQEWWYSNPWEACLKSREFLRLHKEMVLYPTARFKFVPKTWNKPRGICIEENEMQVMQQAVRVMMYQLFQDTLYPNVALAEQSVNANLALMASIDRKNATIDMSEASDRISRELVSWLFQDNQEFHDVLMALSTRFVEPPKELSVEFPNLIRVNKFAPMGSALCFPVMTLVHLALVRSIIEHGAYENIHDLLDRVYVYGDDIVLPSETVEDVYHWLPKFGMKLNKTKSFYRSHFRESCGIHAYKGRDVTPVYIKYTPYHNNAKAVAAAYATEEQLYKKGFTLAAYFQRREIQESYKEHAYVPAGLSQAGFARPFGTEEYRRFKLDRRRKWSVHLQCWTYKVTTIKKQSRRGIIAADDEAYLRWLWVHAKNEGPVGVPFGERVIGDSLGDLTLSTRLVPESALIRKQVDDILENAMRRYPIGRIVKKRNEVVCHKVVLRQSGSLQQQGAESDFSCFC